MSIARMDRLFLLGMRKDQSAIVAALTKLGAVEVRENEVLKQSFLEALHAAEGLDGEPPTMESVEAEELLAGGSERETSPLLKTDDLLAPTLEATDAAVYGRGEGTPTYSGETIAARYYFYDLMQQFATIDEEAPEGAHEFMMQSRTRELLTEQEGEEDTDRRFPRNTAKNIAAQDIPPLRRLCSNYRDWLNELIPQAMKFSGDKRPMFTLKREVLPEAYADAGSRQVEIIDAAIGLEQVIADMSNIRKEIEQVQASMGILEPWRKLSLPEPQERRGRDWGIRTITGSLDSRELLDGVRASLVEDDIPASIEVLGQSETESVAILVAYMEDSQQAVRSVLDGARFAELPRLSGLKAAPGDYKSAFDRQVQRVTKLQEDLTDLEAKGREFAAYKQDFEILHDFYQVQDKKLEAMEGFVQTEHIFVVTGYLPTALGGNVSKALTDRYNVVIELSETDAEEEYPILLQNNKLVKPFEAVMRSFSMPRPGQDLDPTPAMALFYVIFFGMMLGDIGYGAALAGVMAILLWKVKVQGNFRDMTLVLFMSGLASIPFGFLFGGFFGDMITQVSEGNVNFPTLLLNPLEDPINMLIFSMGFGIIHLFGGMALDIRAKIAMGDWQTAAFGVAPWYVIIGGAIALLTGQSWGQWLLIIGFAVLFLLSSPNKNPIKRIFGGLAGLADLGNWLGDVLSYARVLALALATSVIAMVVNILAMIPGYKGVSIVFFVVIMIFGHLLNLALSGLSAYVHTIRLQYVEFFGKFYTGGGRIFEPLNYETRYTYAPRTEEAQLKITRGEFPRVKAKFVQVNNDE